MNVGELARLAGLSVRTLHHWHEVGLLVPSERRRNGYRCYTADDVARLQQVLTYRELGFGLEEVRALLEDPDVDPLDHLRRQQDLLAERIARLQSVAALVARAVEGRSMDIELDPHEIQEVFGDDDPKQHAAEARDRWGDSDAHRQSQARASRYSKQDWLEVQAEMQDVERRFAGAMVAGEPAEGAVARGLAKEHRQHICRRFYDCDLDLHRSLADLYVSDDRFTAHYERVAPGLAQYVHDAVHANAAAAGSASAAGR